MREPVPRVGQDNSRLQRRSLLDVESINTSPQTFHRHGLGWSFVKSSTHQKLLCLRFKIIFSVRPFQATPPESFGLGPADERPSRSPAGASSRPTLLPYKGKRKDTAFIFSLLWLPRRRKQRPPKVSRRMKLFSRIIHQRLTLSRSPEDAL